jgi:hypothetical protein
VTLNNTLWSKDETQALIKEYKKSDLLLYDFALEFSQKHETRSHNSVNSKLHQLKKQGVIEVRNEEKPPAKILLFDIETLPLKVYTWGIRKQYISYENIIADWCVLSWSASWLNSEVVVSDCLSPKEAKERNDRRLLVGIWKLLGQADIVVAHNGRGFDVKKLNARFIHHDMLPPTPYKLVDTLTAARSVFGFSSNKQGYLAKELALPEKQDMDMEDWRKCDAGDPEALEKMRTYNEGDVTTLKANYLKLRAWMPTHPNVGAYVDDYDKCPVCGGETAEVKRYPTNKRARKAWRCVDCGAVGRKA